MELNWSLIAIVVSTCVVILGWYSKRKHSYWSARNVQGPRPWPVFGSLWSVLSKSPEKIELEWARNHGKFYGQYLMMEPILTIADPELIKQVMVKDFDKFVNRRMPIIHDEIWDLNLFELEDEKWKAVRSITSPTFTSGKLRGMQALMNKTVDRLLQYFDKISTSSDNSLDIKEVIGGFTMDTIALTSFSTETDTNGDRTTKSPFLEHAKKFFDFDIAKILLIVLAPKFLLKMLNVTSFFNQKSMTYLIELNRQILRNRIANIQKNGSSQKQNDLVQLLLDASVDEKELANTDYSKLSASADNDQEDNVGPTQSSNSNSTKRKLTENELIAQCLIFMVAGYETTAATLSHLLYELAMNQDIQDRLCDEIQQTVDNIKDSNSSEFFETAINGIPLLEATMKETLRKYPPVARLERRLGVEKYKLAGVELQKNQLVEIAAYAVHHDKDYYPDPERFNPERFMPENKHLLVPYTYLPFGQGPRNCVGMRFAYQEMKLLLAQLLTRYRFEPTPDTPNPLSFKRGSGLISVSSLPLKVFKR